MLILALLATVQILCAIYQLILFRNLKSSYHKAKNKSLFQALKNEELLHHIYLSLENLTKSRELPPRLTSTPYADETGIISSIKTIKIPSAPAAYNAALGTTENGHILFFRYDSPNFGNDRVPFFSNIGCIHLDPHFEPLDKEFSKIETHSAFSEDARFFQNKGHHYLLYNDLALDQRGLRIGAIDLKNKTLEYVTALSTGPSKMEKNWTPFSIDGEIHLLHTINPQKILALPDPKQNLLRALPTLPGLQIEWSDKWGLLRGGTPAVVVDGEYLSFFHSSFEDRNGVIWYVFGAYTFPTSAPFKLSRISPYPILFKGIYDTVHHTIANPKIRAIYPTGLIYEGGDTIYVSCGENDSGVKIISMDKTKLLASLKCL